MMKKLLILLLVLLCGCAQQPEERVSLEMPDIDETKVLIAYFTWAENTVVENESAIDPDATTSASVLLPGNAGQMATWIQEEIGGDLFSIVVEDPYSNDYDECLERAADEKADAVRPNLIHQVENIDDYDVVYLGFPNWWYTCPMAIFSFVETYDLSDKVIVPFVTHGTGGFANTIDDLKAELPQSYFMEAIGIEREDVSQSENIVKDWARHTQQELS